MPVGFTTVTASLLQDMTGAAVTNSTIYFTPVGNSGLPLAFKAGGAGGQVVSKAVQTQVTNGAFSINLADTTLTNPVNVGYKVCVIDNLTGETSLEYSCVQPFGTTWNFDSYDPNVGAQALIQSGPAGQSAYQLAVTNGFSGTQAQWLASLQGAPGADGSVTAAQLGSAASAVAASAAKINQNIFISAQAVDGIIAIANGVLSYAGAGLGHASGKFGVVAGGNVICTANTNINGNPNFGWAFFDYQGNSLPGVVGVPAATPVAVPALAVQGQVSLAEGTDLTTIMIFNGTTLPASYVPPGVDATIYLEQQATLSGTVSASAVLNYVEAIKSANAYAVANLYNPATVTTGTIISAVDGSLISGLPATYQETARFPVFPSNFVACTLSTGLYQNVSHYGWKFWDINNVFISGAQGTLADGISYVPTPANAAYSSVSFNSDGWPQDSFFNKIPPVIQLGKTVVQSGPPQPLAGKKWFHWGDSISAVFGVGWEQLVVANTGLVQVGQDARGGRALPQIFENYQGDPVNGLGLAGKFQAAAGSSIYGGTNTTAIENMDSASTNAWTPAGKTLTQDLTALAPVIGTVYLGTNDAFMAGSLGVLGDMYPTQQTYYGFLNWAYTSILTACPGMQLIIITPYLNAHTAPSTAVIAAAQCAQAASMGLAVLDLCSTSGINPLTWAQYLIGDFTHPAQPGSVLLGNRIGKFLNANGNLG